jgi:hypothetical protein
LPNPTSLYDPKHGSSPNNAWPLIIHRLFCGWTYFLRLANASYDDLSNARTPQNRDSYKSVEVGCVQLLFEPGAIRLNGFHTYLELRRDFQGCFAIAK